MFELISGLFPAVWSTKIDKICLFWQFQRLLVLVLLLGSVGVVATDYVGQNE